MSRVALRKRSPNGRPRDSVNRHRAALPVVSRLVMRRRVLLNVGAAMQEAREAANIAAEEVAARMGVNWRTVASWESGRICPTLPEVCRFALAVGTQPSALLEDV